MIKKSLEYISKIGRRSTETTDNHDIKIAMHVKQLKEKGFVILDHLVNSKEFKELKKEINKNIEDNLNLKFPCLAQSKIDENRDKDLIVSNFLATDKTLSERNLTFIRNDIKSYDDMINKFSPSTLTLEMQDRLSFFNIWLDKTIIAIVQSYMGFIPEMVEAYVRRNFPCKYKVMNHFWHRDTNHSEHLLKAFIFFTDCDINTGAHHYISESINEKKFNENRYFSDEEIHSHWPKNSKNHIISKVKAGTVIIEDTRGLHKAGTPNVKYRDLGFAVFLPPNIFRKKKSFYKISKSNYNLLSKNQQLYIPNSNFI
tara:strand:- start:192 stop:1130 length:939 start_codon:yes stop_codon:yes gene_type:complete